MHPDVAKILEAAEAPLDGVQTSGPEVSGSEAPRRRRAWPVLPVEARHGLAGRILEIIEPHTEADPAALLVQFLTAFGSAAGRSAHDKVEDDKHYTNLYCLIVGQTSRARKGTSWGRIRRLFQAADPVWTDACIASGLTSGEGLVARLGGDEESYDDKRLLVFEPEFARVLKIIQREGNTLSALLREAWDRDILQVLNKCSPLRATGAHVSIIAHITAEELARLLTATEAANGFANRYLIACARRSRLLPRGGNLHDEQLTPLVMELRAALEHARRTSRVGLTEAALHQWNNVYPALTAERPGMAGALCARAEAHVVRLSLVYALLDGANTIDSSHLRAALAVWSYCSESINLLFGEQLGDPTADAIVEQLQRAGGSLSRWELYNALGRHIPSQEISRAVRLLTRLNRVAIAKLQTRGRPAEMLTLVKSVSNCVESVESVESQ